jgi:hypothetical protein
VRKGNAITRLAHGTFTNSMVESQRRPLALTKCSLDERTGSRYMPRALILAPQRSSMVSSRPITTGAYEGFYQQNQQLARHRPGRPRRSVEDTLEGTKVGIAFARQNA